MKPEWVGTKKGDVAAAATVFTGYVNKMYENIWNRWRANYMASEEMRQAAYTGNGEPPRGVDAKGFALTGVRGATYAATIFAAMYLAVYSKEAFLKNRKIDLRDKNDFRWIMSQTLAYSGRGTVGNRYDGFCLGTARV